MIQSGALGMSTPTAWEEKETNLILKKRRFHTIFVGWVGDDIDERAAPCHEIDRTEPHRGRDLGAGHGVWLERRRHHRLWRVCCHDEEEKLGDRSNWGTMLQSEPFKMFPATLQPSYALQGQKLLSHFMLFETLQLLFLWNFVESTSFELK